MNKEYHKRDWSKYTATKNQFKEYTPCYRQHWDKGVWGWRVESLQAMPRQGR